MEFESVKKTSQLLSEAFALYKNNWAKLVSAYVLVFIVSFFSGAIFFLINYFTLNACSTTNEILLLLFCLFPWIGAFLIAFLFSFLNTFVLLAVLKPIQQVASRSEPANWTEYFSINFFRSIVVMLTRLFIACFLAIPFILFIFLNVELLREKFLLRLVAPVTAFFGGSLIGFPIMLFATYFAMAVANYFLMFFELEYVLNKRGVLKSLLASMNLVMLRPLDCLVFASTWWLIWLALWIGDVVPTCFSTICHLIQLFSLAWALVALPIQNISLVLLWSKLMKTRIERPSIETTDSPDEYLEQMKSRMVLSWQ